MKKNKNSLKLAQEWFDKGDSDLDSAERLYKDKGYTDTICFLTQQAIEKYLKGFLVFHHVSPRKIHDLEELCKDCSQIDKKFLDFIEDFSLITKYYIDTRYPVGIPTDYSREDTRKALDVANDLVKLINKKVFG